MCLGGILLVTPDGPALPHPVSPNALDIDWFLDFLSHLVGHVQPAGRVLFAQAPQARGTTPGIVAIVVQVIEAILGVIYDGGASLCRPRNGPRWRTR